MASGNLTVLAKNLCAAPKGFAAFASSIGQHMATYKKIKDRQFEFAPEDVKNQAEVYDDTYWKRHLCQHKNMWIDKELSTVVSRQDLVEYQKFKVDGWKMAHCLAPLAVFGGYALPFYALWFGNDTWMPSTMPQTPEQLAEWRAAQDLYRYKYAPAVMTNFKWFLESHIKLPDEMHACWDELFEKNDVRRDPVLCWQANKWYEQFQPFFLIRRQQARAIGRAMGLPTFPTWGKICTQARIRDYWELAWTEDHMVMSQDLVATMSDEELYDYAWRRFLAPYDKNLDRQQLVARVADYHTFLGKDFLSEGKAPNIFVTLSYVFGYYNDPAFLDMDISELEGNDFEHLASWPKDAFLQRLEFENGPLRDQVEAHTQKKIAEREAKLKELA